MATVWAWAFEAAGHGPPSIITAVPYDRTQVAIMASTVISSIISGTMVPLVWDPTIVAAVAGATLLIRVYLSRTTTSSVVILDVVVTRCSAHGPVLATMVPASSPVAALLVLADIV